MIIEKLISKRGQISMELGILVAAAVAVAAIAAYFYATNVRDSARNAGQAANGTIGNMSIAAREYASRLTSL